MGDSDGGGFIFCESDYPQTSFSVFQDMKRKDEYTDVTITCNSQKFSAHRLVLAARIPHFRKILPPSVNTVSLDEIHPDVLQSLIDFAYEGKLKVTPENVEPMLFASVYFHVDRVEKVCWEFLQKESAGRECEHGSCVKPLPSDETIRKKFDEFSDTPAFLLLPYSSVKELLKRNDLMVKNEENVFEATMRWVMASPVERQHHLPHLLTEIRMANLSPNFLVEKVAEQQLIKKSDQCRHIVDQAKTYHLLPRKRSMSFSFETGLRKYTDSHLSEPSQSGNTTTRVSFPLAPITNPPFDNSYKSGLYVVYWQNSLSASVMQFKCGNKELSPLLSSDPSEIVHAAVSMNSKIYVFAEKSLKAFSLVTHEWTNIGEIPVAVNGSGIVAFNSRKKIYVFGGNCMPDIVRSFDVRSCRWRQKEDMKVPRRDMGVLSSGRCIYVTGGFNESCCDLFQQFSPFTKQWKSFPRMLTRRMGHGCAELYKKIYVCCGVTDNQRLLNTAEVYHKGARQWTYISSPNLHCRSLSLVSWYGRLWGFAVQPSDANGHLVYQREKDEWKFVPLEFSGGHCPAIKAVVVRNPHG